MDVLDGPYYFHCKTYLGVFGVWSLHPARAKHFLRVLSYVICLTIFVPSLCKAYELRHHLYYFLLCLPSLVFYTQYFIKLTYLIFKDSQLRQLLELIKRDFRSYTGKNLEILHRYAREATKVNKMYAYYLLGIVCTFNVASFIPGILDALLPLNVTRAESVPRLIKYNIPHLENNLYVMASHSFVLDMFATILIVGFDALLLNCTQHSCALFKIVAKETKNVLDRRINSKSARGCRSVLYKEIARVIELHKHALHFVDLVESTYASQQLLIATLTLGAITLSEFEIATNKIHRQVRFRFIVYGAGELLHILFHNYPGQRVKDHSLMIYQSCYDSAWYRQDVPNECKKLLNLMMLRSQKPCYLTAGGLHVLGLENYAAILKASLSYFTFLSSVQ